MDVSRRQLLASLATVVTVSGSGLVISSSGSGVGRRDSRRGGNGLDRSGDASGGSAPSGTDASESSGSTSGSSRPPGSSEPSGSSDAGSVGAQDASSGAFSSGDSGQGSAASAGGEDGAITGELNVGDGTIFTDDGYLKSLTAAIQGRITYDGLERAANSVDLQLFAAPHGGDLTDPGNRIAHQNHQVSDSPKLKPYAGIVSFRFVDVDVLSADDLSAEGFSAPDGESKTTEIDFRLRVVIRDTSGKVVLQGGITTTTKVTVVNEPEGGDTKGNGSISGGGSNEEP